MKKTLLISIVLPSAITFETASALSLVIFVVTVCIVAFGVCFSQLSAHKRRDVIDFARALRGSRTTRRP